MQSLKIKNLECNRNGRSIFTGISFDVTPGRILLLSGKNGSGKTSLLRILAGLMPPKAGSIVWGDKKFTDKRDRELFSPLYIGHSNPVKLGLTVRENLIFWAKIFGHGLNVDAALEQFGIRNHSELPASYLSEGQKRRLTLARLALDQPVSTLPSLWVLDEPAWGLDPEAVKTLSNLAIDHVKNQGMVIISTHGNYLDELLALNSDRYSLTENNC